MTELTLTPRRPYILRAFYEWLVENDLTPHIVVDATLPRVDVPMEYVKDGQIVLNISPAAVGDLDLGLDEVFFNARFGGRPMSVIVPLYAVLAIYARENGSGTMFDQEPAYDELLQAIKNAETDSNTGCVQETSFEIADAEEAPACEKPKGRPTLTVVK